MSKKQTRRSISISLHLFEDAVRASNASGLSITTAVRDFLERFVRGELEVLDKRSENDRRWHGNRKSADQEPASGEARLPVARSGALKDAVRIEVSEGTASMIEDQVVRARELRGETVTDSQVLEAAANAFLDSVGAK